VIPDIHGMMIIFPGRFLFAKEKQFFSLKKRFRRWNNNCDLQGKVQV